MAIESYFFNAVQSGSTYDRVYNAEDVTSYLNLLVGNGVFPNPSTQLQVRASSGMTVIVGAGSGWINGHKMVNTADMTLTLDPSDVLLNRIDDIIFYVDYNNREMGIAIKKGTAASSPTAPTLQRDSTRYEMCLAQIAVNKQVAAITGSMITDTRGNSSLCGYVQGLIQQMDTTTMFDQWQAGFEEWFSEVKDELSTATLLRKFEYDYTTVSANESTFNVQSFIEQYAYALDILEIRINGLTLTASEYTRDENVVTLTTPIAEKGTPISFCIYKSVDGSDAQSIVETVYDLEQWFNATRILASDGGVKNYVTSSSAIITDVFTGMGIGFHTLYAISSVLGLPKATPTFLFGEMTDTSSGYLFAIASDGSTYVNTYDARTWMGWRTLFEYDANMLWSSTGAYPNSGMNITPSKPLLMCQHGWLLTFQGWDISSQQPTGNLIQTAMIPKYAPDGTPWSGETMSFPLVIAEGTASMQLVAKAFQVYNTRLVSGPYNAQGDNRNLVLMNIREF